MIVRIKIWLIAAITIISFQLKGQVVHDTLTFEKAFSLSLEELASIKVRVGNVSGVDIFSIQSTVSIIDRETIERYNFLSVAEALTIVPGIDVLQTIIDWNVTTSRGILQNFYANKVLLMINNIPTWQPLYGNGHLERIDIQDVQRIEVLKGPCSVVYGSNAYTAVINIILREEETNTINSYGQVGIPNLMGGGVNFRSKFKDFNFYLSMNARFEDRHSYEMQSARGRTYNGDSTFLYNEQYQSGNMTFKGNYKAHSLTLNLFNFTHTFMGAYPSYSSGGGNLVDNHGVLLAYNFDKQLSDRLKLKALVSTDHFQRHFFLSPDRTNKIHLSAVRHLGDIKLDYQVNSKFTTEFGVSSELRAGFQHKTLYALTDSLITNNLTIQDNILESSVYIQPKFTFNDITILLGARFTNNSLLSAKNDFSFNDIFSLHNQNSNFWVNNLSLRSTAMYRFNKNNSVKLIAGQAFRAPTIFEMYFDHYTVVGNDSLMPEKSTSVELAYLNQSGDFFVQGLFYIANYYNLIERIAVAPDLPNIYRNVADFWGKGLEFELAYRNDQVASFFLNYNFVKEIDNSGIENYRFVPDHTLSLGASKKFEKLYCYSKGRFISSVDGHLGKIEPQLAMDLGLGFVAKFKSLKIRHDISLKNITHSEFLIPEYIRQTPNINSIPTMGYGTRIIYTMFIHHE